MGLNINLDIIEGAQKYGKLSDPRNRIIDLCKTKYLAFLDGDDKIRLDALQKYINECKNNNLGNPEGRKNFDNTKGIFKGEADIIYLDSDLEKEEWGNIYNVQVLRDNGIRLTKQVGAEDGYFKAALFQNNLKVVIAADENRHITVGYIPSYSTIGEKEKYFEEIIQLTNHLARHNKNGVQIWNEDFKPKAIKFDPEKEFILGEITSDPNNIFHYFSSGSRNRGYGGFSIFPRFPKSDNDYKIDLMKCNAKYEEEENTEHINNCLAIVFSIILYPEVLSNGEDKDYFLKIRRELQEKIQNGDNSVKIIKLLENDEENFSRIVKKMKNNFLQPEIFEKHLNNIDEFLDKNNKREILNRVLLNLEIDINTNLLKKIRNPHLTGDTSKISEIVDFDQYFSANELKKKPENEQIRIMNKILKGKFLPKDSNERNTDSEHNFIIEYISNYYNGEDVPFILNIIQKTNTYNNNLEVKELVDRKFGIDKNKSIQNIEIIENSENEIKIDSLVGLVQEQSTSPNKLNDEKKSESLIVEKNISVGNDPHKTYNEIIASALEGIKDVKINIDPIIDILNTDIKKCNSTRHKIVLERNLTNLINILSEENKEKLKYNLSKKGTIEKLNELSKNSGIQLGSLLIDKLQEKKERLPSYP